MNSSSIDLAVGAHETAQAPSFEGVDVAGGGLARGAHADGDRAQDGVEVERGAELEARVGERAEFGVALAELFEQERVAESPGDDLTDAAREVDVLGVVATADRRRAR